MTKVQTQKFRSFGFVLTLITVFVYFCFNKDVLATEIKKAEILCYLHGNWTCCYILSGVHWSHRSVSHHMLVPDWCILSFLFVYHQLPWYSYSRSSTHSSHHPPLQCCKRKHLINNHRRHVWIIYHNKVRRCCSLYFYLSL